MARLIDGLDITIAADALDDMELLEDLAELQDGKYGKLGAVLTRLSSGSCVASVAMSPAGCAARSKMP